MSRISRFAPAVLIAAALAPAAPALAIDATAAPASEAVAQACRHYDNRARFLPRGADAPLLARLADACALAAGALTDPATPGTRRATAAHFLGGLTEARAVIDAINGDRLRVAYAADAADAGGRVRELNLEIGMVSPSGEYLILRAAGVIDALAVWTPRVEASADAPPPPY